MRGIAVTLAAGSLLGLTAAWFAGRLVKSLVFGVQPADPAIFAGALITLVATAAIAAYIPARRAARNDPMESLRTD